MRNIEMTDLSMDDLIELEKRIKVEKNRRHLLPFPKKDLVKDTRIIKLIEKRFQEPKYDAMTRFDVISGINRSMYYLCDIALKNYKDYEPKCVSHSKKYAFPQLAKIREESNALSIKTNANVEKSVDQYIAMFSELSEVFMKYVENQTL